MTSRTYPPRPLLGVSAAIWRGNQVLLVRRNQPPSKGLWALPGGLLKVGESLQEGVRREVAEETGLILDEVHFSATNEIVIRDNAGAVERHYVLMVYAGEWQGGEPVAGDDAGEVRWVSPLEIDAMPTTKELAEIVGKTRQTLNSALSIV